MKQEIENHIRSFGMSGYLVTDELRAIESRYSIELGHVSSQGGEESSNYFTQFEQTVRAEAAYMAPHYETFYCLEKAMRKLIAETLQDAEGGSWWSSARIPQNVSQDVSSRIRREVDSGVTRRSEDSIDYTTFGELSTIITANWDIFGAVFTSKRAVERVMTGLNLLRGPIAHCCPMTEDEVDRLNLAVKDWFRLMG